MPQATFCLRNPRSQLAKSERVTGRKRIVRTPNSCAHCSSAQLGKMCVMVIHIARSVSHAFASYSNASRELYVVCVTPYLTHKCSACVYFVSQEASIHVRMTDRPRVYTVSFLTATYERMQCPIVRHMQTLPTVHTTVLHAGHRTPALRYHRPGECRSGARQSYRWCQYRGNCTKRAVRCTSTWHFLRTLHAV